MRISKKYYFSLTILSIALCISVIAIIKQEKKNSNIDRNKYETIAIVDTVITRRTSSNIYYTFFYEGVEINASESKYYDRIKSTIGKFYQVEVSKETPSNSRILLNAEVNDTIVIEKAGFSLRKTKTVL